MKWYEELENYWRSRIVEHRASTKKIAKRSNLTWEQAAQLRSWVRGGDEPSCDAPEAFRVPGEGNALPARTNAVSDAPERSLKRGADGSLSQKGILSLDDLMRAANVDQTKWTVDKWIANVWDGKPQAKAWMSRKPEGWALDALNASGKARSVRKIKLNKPASPYCCVVGLSDFHWGKRSNKIDNGEEFNRDVARKRLFKSLDSAMANVARMGAPDKIYLPVGSDFLNIDNPNNTTTSGTPQDSDTTYSEMLITGCRLMEEVVDNLRQVAPVELVLMPGNHDRASGLSIMLYLEALYRKTDDVEISVEDMHPRQYVAYGKNLIGFVHGDGVKKTNDLAGHMAREASEHWHHCTERTVYTGHLHYEKTQTDVAFSVTRRQLPSLSGPDCWHNLNGYVGAPKSLPVYCHDIEDGIIAVFHGKP